MNHEQLKRILEMLRFIKRRPRMYIGNSAEISPFQSGFYLALKALDLLPPDFESVHNQVVKQRNWEWNAMGVWGQMKNQGYDDDAIIAELIDIDIAVFERLVHQSDESESE